MAANGGGTKCFNCGGEGHFAQECPSTHNNVGTGGGGGGTPASTPRYWTPRRAQEEPEEREFLRQLIAEKKEEQARKRDLEERRKMDEMIRMEIERNSEALEPRVMSKIGRQYLMARDEVRREEVNSPFVRTSARKCTDGEVVGYSCKGLEEIEDKTAKLHEIRERKRKGKALSGAARRPFRQPIFQQDDDVAAAESSHMGEERRKTKVAVGSGPEGVLAYVQAQRKLLMTKNKDQLKAICANEGVQYTTKAPTIQKIIEAYAKVAYEGFIFTPASPAASPEDDQTPASSGGVLLGQVVGVPMGKSSSCPLACILCTYAKWMFLSNLGMERRLVDGFRIIDDVTIFMAVAGDNGDLRAACILYAFGTCYGFVLRLLRTDDGAGHWTFVGIDVFQYGVALRTVALMKNLTSIWESGDLVFGSFQDFVSYSGKRAKVGAILSTLHRLFRLTSDIWGLRETILAVKRELLIRGYPFKMVQSTFRRFGDKMGKEVAEEIAACVHY
ncbi:hypothetical protein CBR_g23013 [Chara braunii]|uniref:CCHC-type domain-containing protein n=1 Tax=Chara braunii TaxID=69332 RepID=A0A388L3H0_CHABU|nr:hypothetical protein CBR_g23013 [Chara braunii]|eukprot:GBG76798.1 hypothetical protein CBR_g23013 [Chara braunii]